MGWAYQDSFTKSFGEDVTLGQEFVSCVVDANFDVVKKFSLMRTAFFLTNATSLIVQDGISRLLEKSDIDKLSSKKVKPTLETCEDILFRSWASVKARISAKERTMDDMYAAYGRLACRLTLFITKKEKQGYEKKKYASMTEIERLFTSDVSGETPKSDAAPSANPTEAGTAAGEGDRTSLGPLLTSVENAASSVYVAGLKGFILNNLYANRGADAAKGIYKLTALTEGVGLEFTEVVIGDGTPNVTICSFYSMQTWVPFRGECPQKLEFELTNFGPDAPWVAFELEKVGAFRALAEFASEHADVEHESLSYYINPCCVRASAPLKKGALKLVPFTDGIAKLSIHSATSKGTVVMKPTKGGSALSFVIAAPTKKKELDQEKWSKNAVCSASWWLDTTDEASLGNMEVKFITSHGFSFPVYVNSRAISKHEKLCLFKKPDVKRKSGSASSDGPNKAQKK